MTPTYCAYEMIGGPWDGHVFALHRPRMDVFAPVVEADGVGQRLMGCYRSRNDVDLEIRQLHWTASA